MSQLAHLHCIERISWSKQLIIVSSRGGVEDTRLMAKAKGTKKSEAKAKDSPSEDRPSWGQGPRTQAQVFSKKERSSKKFFRRSPKKRSSKFFSGNLQNFNNSKNAAVLEPTTGQFSRTWGFEAKAKDLTFEAKANDIKMYPRGLHLW